MKQELTIDARDFIKNYPEVINTLVKRFESEVEDNIRDYPDMLEENIRDETAKVINDVVYDAHLQI